MNPFAHFEDQFGHLQLSDNDAALHVFLAGWNSAMMEMMQRVNKMPFGDDTRASFAVYFQSQMVNVDAIEKPAQQTIHCKHRRENNGVCPHHNLHCGWPKCNEPEQPAHQEPVAVKHMLAWVAYLKRKSDNGQHMQIPSGMSAGSCWDLALELEQFINTSSPAQQEPVAVVSGYYGGQCVILPIDPARIYNSNTPLYTSPQPCPTCEALARTVMLDQTSHDAQRKPLTLQERTRIVRANKMYHDKDEIDAYGVIDDVEAAHGIREKNT